MRIKRLDLKAFGPFTDRTLAFESRCPGLHIIFGANEAGKSSSLRALKSLLYGFPERTSDNFQHANDQLLVGGCIEDSDGRELVFYRRKKRKADLLDHDRNLLDQSALATFLNGTDPILFELLYGIDHETLVAGGEDILAQKGEVGQALFAAGTGISSLKKILDSLEAEANDLYKDRGSKQQITQAIREYKDQKKIVKDSSLPPGKWRDHQKRLQRAEIGHAALEEELKQKSAEVQRLTRLHKAIPELAVLENLESQLRDLGDVVVLSIEFTEKLGEVEQGKRNISLQRDKDSDRVEKLRQKKQGITINQTLLDQADTIEDLHQRLGEYRKGQHDRGVLDGNRIAHHQDAEALISGIRPGLTSKDVESLRPVLGKKRMIQKLSSSHEALNQKSFQAGKQMAAAKKELEEIDQKLSDLPDTRDGDGLAKAISLAQKLGDIDPLIDGITRDSSAGKKGCLAELDRLGLWSGELEKLLHLTLPMPETVTRFDHEYGDLERERQQLKKELQQADEEMKVARRESAEVVYGGEVPTEDDLESSRNRRQYGWRLLRRHWIDGEDVTKEAGEYEPGQALHDAYENQVEEADRMADRLRREADRVAKAASLRAKIESLDNTNQELVGQESNLAGRQAHLEASWISQWESTEVEVRTPKEMLAWLTEIEKLRYRLTEIFSREGEASDRDEARRRYRNELLAQLSNLGESREFPGRELMPVLAFAEAVLTDIAKQAAEKDRLSERRRSGRAAVDKAQNEQAEADADKLQWQARWSKAISGLGLAEEVLPGDALDLLETLGNGFVKLESANDLQTRIDGIDRDAQKFSADVKIVLLLTATGLKNLSPDQSVLQLNAMLGNARRDSELLNKTNEEIESLVADIEDAERTMASRDGQMAELLAEARCKKAADLAEAIRKSTEFQRLHEKISDAKSSLAKVSEGVSIEEIKLQAAEAEMDELPGQIDSLNRQITEDLSPRINEALKLIGEETKELQLMDGKGQAAQAEEKKELIAARIRRLTDEYARIKLATLVLKQEIERYRDENQDPILQIASRVFAELTLGSFAGLRTDVGDNGDPVLIGVRPDDSRVTVEGMSDGTRDQLFLALRLATVELRLETNEPMPFIVDDILINFDDDRSRATIKVLADLAMKNQVILFTHHRKIVDEANSLSDPGIFQVHELQEA